MNRLMAFYKANAGRGLPLAFEKKSDDTTEIMLYGVIGWDIEASEFVAELEKVDTPEILLRAHSPGGDVFDGVAMYHALKAHPAKVTARVEGVAASAASFIIMAADEIEMGESTQLMLHCSWGFTVGNKSDHEAQAKVLGGIDADMSELYAKRAGGTVDEWAAVMEGETWYRADDAVKAGLADRKVEAQTQAEITFDLSAFKAPSKAEVQEITVQPKVDFSEFNAELDKAEARVDGFLAKLGKALGMGGTTKEPVEPTIDPPAPAFVEGSRAALLSRLESA